MDILRSKHVDRNKTNANFQLFFLAGFLNCLAGQRVYKRLCGSDPRIAGRLGAMECAF